ncbi:MAG: arginine--tRNA ligase, partial [Myxococcales bacterium]|nr:arginine--tRNA ligase [Myxococcales bacterium]
LTTHEAIAEATVAGPGFVNVRLADSWIASRITEILDDDRDGVPPVSKPQRIVVDFSAPNIAKQMHVGHLRSTIIGDAIVRMHRFLGHEVIGDNHIGDWGTQFGLLIVGMEEWGSEEALAKEPIDELERIYKLASAKAKDDPPFADRAREELHKLQQGDPKNKALWERFVEATRTTLERCYDVLDVRFDTWLGESAYDSMLPGVVETLLDKGIAREDQGAICVFWDELEDAPKDLKKQKQPFIVRKKDGAYLYSTTDIATVVFRKDTTKADRAVYVVDTRQALHFKQLFAVVKLLGIDLELTHVGFGMMLGTDGKPLRTRDASGKTVPLLQLLGEAVERAEQRMREEGLDIPEERIQEIAKVVGIGAVKYADLRQNRASDYQFDLDKLISFKGNAGPYMQYAYARIHSILDKAETTIEGARGEIQIGHEAEAELARWVLSFGDMVHEATTTYQPHLITEHLYDLARSFSTFYEACPILKAEPAIRTSRLALAALTARQIRRGLDLLGIGVIERM